MRKYRKDNLEKCRKYAREHWRKHSVEFNKKRRALYKIDSKYRTSAMNRRHRWQNGLLIKIQNLKLSTGCQLCHYKKYAGALEFHHRDKDTKKFSINIKELSHRNWQEVQEEIKKCVLLCSNCHAEVHAGISQI